MDISNTVVVGRMGYPIEHEYALALFPYINGIKNHPKLSHFTRSVERGYPIKHEYALALSG